MLRRTFTLGRYNCVERLGSGPIGETWRAKVYGPAGVEGQLALLRLHGHLAEASTFLGRLEAALERYRALEHRGVPRLVEIGQKGPQRFVVFELAPGVPLPRLRAALLQAAEPDRAQLPAIAAALGRDLAELVAYAHSKGARALGLWPPAVLVDAAGVVHLTELGLAEARLPGDPQAPELAPLLPYLPPELRRGDVTDARSDVFAIAALVHELLTGAPPPESALRPGGRLPIPADAAAPALWQALQQALRPRPADRPPSAAELAALFGAACPEGLDVAALCARLGPRLGRAEADPLAEGAAEPLPPSPGERVLHASSAESAPRPPEPPGAVVLPPAAFPPRPLQAALAVAPRQLAGVVLAVEEEEHTVPVPHSPKSKIKVIEAEPPGSRVGLGVGLAEPRDLSSFGREDSLLRDPEPSSRAPSEASGGEVTVVPGMPATSPGADPLRNPSLDMWAVPGMSTDPGSGPSDLLPAAPPSMVLPGRGAAPSLASGEISDEELSDFDEPTSLADYGAAGPAGAAPAAPAATAAPSAISWELSGPPPSPALADRFPPLITDPVPLVAPEEIEAELPFPSAQSAQSRVTPEVPTPASVLAPASALTPVAPSAPAPAPAIPVLPPLSKDDETFDDLLEEDEPTGSIPDAPAKRLAELVQEEPRAPSQDTGPGVLQTWAPPALVPQSAPLFPISEPVPPLPAPQPLSSAPPPPPVARTAGQTAPSPQVPASPTATTGPAAAVPPGASPAAPPTVPSALLAAARPAPKARLVSPAVAIAFGLALLVGGSAPVVYRLLRRPPRPAQVVAPADSDKGAALERGPGLEKAAAEKAPAPDKGPAADKTVNPESPKAAPAAPGALALRTAPPGAAVILDGKPAGKTPASLPLGPGRHRLVLLLDRHKLVKRDVEAGASVDVKLEPAALPVGVAGPGGLKVRCTTKGQLRIFVDGHDTGYNCPTERIALSPGPHKIEFFRPKTGDTVTKPVTIKKGKGSTRLYTKL